MYFMLLELTYTRLFTSLSLNPHAPSLETKVLIGTDLSQFLQYSLLPTIEMVLPYRIGSPQSEFEYAKLPP